jgi:NarL family two-component system response regulator LiaR
MEAAESSVVVLDRHPMWLQAISGVLSGRGFDVVCSTSDPVVALAAVGDCGPAVVLFDPAGGGDAAGFVQSVLVAAPGVKVIAISDADEGGFVEAMFAAGVSLFVLKTATEVELVAALQMAVTTAVHLGVAQRRVGSVVPLAVVAQPEGDPLTRREREILGLAAEGLSNGEMARLLWVTEQTVKFHLSNIYRKLDVPNRTAAARWAQLNGVATASELPAAELAV